jgi:hypothetical protein
MDDWGRAKILIYFFARSECEPLLPRMISKDYWEKKRQADSRPRDPVPLYKTDPIYGVSVVRTSAQNVQGLRMMRAPVVA